jgi:2-dehydro-3-deoxygalactonokinase
MTKPAFIAGDWGTSNLRLALCDHEGHALDLRRGPGAAAARGHFAEAFDDLTREWRAHGELPALLCGMVGSAFGWREAAYLPSPAELSELADSLVSPRANAHIVPGMRCTNPLGAPDVMRGEETQLLGALSGGLAAGLGTGRQLVCLPGTHTKWVSVHGGVVQEFLTVPSGEIFALLCDHSVLVRDPQTPVTDRAAEFERGLQQAARHPEIPVLHKIFQARSLRLDKQLAPDGAASWMSGLLIGTDVAGALQLFPDLDRHQPVYVVGAPHLTAAYSSALARAGLQACVVDGEASALAGLTWLYRELARRAEAQ